MREWDPGDIVAFWFSAEMSAHWFNSTDEIDNDITQRYESLWLQAKQGRLDEWQKTATGSLALVIILDQFPLNMYRGQPDSFATEAQGIAVAKRAIAAGFDKELEPQQCVFLYMPLMHSENMQDQDYCVALFEALGLSDNIRFAKHHQAIIQQFGRFPHRNTILGRESSQAEIDYMNSKEAFKG